MAGSPVATTTSGRAATVSRATSGMCAEGPTCVVTARLRPSTKPSLASSGITMLRNASIEPAENEISATRCTLSGACAYDCEHHESAMPPRSVMNAKRFTQLALLTPCTRTPESTIPRSEYQIILHKEFYQLLRRNVLVGALVRKGSSTAPGPIGD